MSDNASNHSEPVEYHLTHVLHGEVVKPSPLQAELAMCVKWGRYVVVALLLGTCAELGPIDAVRTTVAVATGGGEDLRRVLAACPHFRDGSTTRRWARTEALVQHVQSHGEACTLSFAIDGPLWTDETFDRTWLDRREAASNRSWSSLWDHAEECWSETRDARYGACGSPEDCEAEERNFFVQLVWTPAPTYFDVPWSEVVARELHPPAPSTASP